MGLRLRQYDLVQKSDSCLTLSREEWLGEVGTSNKALSGIDPIVNGSIAYSEGRVTGATPGMVLRA